MIKPDILPVKKLMKSVCYYISLLLILSLAACVRQPQIKVYCVPYDQWQALSPQKQHEAVEWFNKNGTIVPENLEYKDALGDAKFRPPGAYPPKGIPYEICYHNMYYATEHPPILYPKVSDDQYH